MTRSWMQFAFGTANGLAIAVALNLLPYWRTYDAPGTDGHAIMGFPFTFRREGGFSPRYDFHPALLLADAAIGIGLALLVGWVAVKVAPLIYRSGCGFPVLRRSDG